MGVREVLWEWWLSSSFCRGWSGSKLGENKCVRRVVVKRRVLESEMRWGYFGANGPAREGDV